MKKADVGMHELDEGRDEQTTQLTISTINRFVDNYVYTQFSWQLNIVNFFPNFKTIHHP